MGLRLGIVAAVVACLVSVDLIRAAEKPPAPVRIVCIGDSITQGRKGAEGDPKNAPTYSYRYPLWKKLLDAGVNVDFVGTQKAGFEGTPAYALYRGKEFDNEHEGYWGWTTQAVAEKLRKTGTEWTADIALVMLGSNDKEKEQTLEPTLKAMTDIVDTLRKNNPRITILIGRPFQEWKPFPDLGKAYADLAPRLTKPVTAVTAVNLSGGWVSKPDAPGTCTVDWVHPNAVGDEKIAECLFQAMRPYLERQAPIGK